MLRFAVVAALGIGAIALGSQAAANETPERQQQLNVTGTYHSNYNDVKLTQDGNRVYGTYVCCGGGTIKGTIEGRTLRYIWRQPNSWGSGVWTIQAGRLDGTWGSQQDAVSGGRWDLTRVKPSSQIAN